MVYIIQKSRIRKYTTKTSFLSLTQYTSYVSFSRTSLQHLRIHISLLQFSQERNMLYLIICTLLFFFFFRFVYCCNNVSWSPYCSSIQNVFLLFTPAQSSFCGYIDYITVGVLTTPTPSLALGLDCSGPKVAPVQITSRDPLAHRWCQFR